MYKARARGWWLNMKKRLEEYIICAEGKLLFFRGTLQLYILFGLGGPNLLKMAMPSSSCFASLYDPYI